MRSSISVLAVSGLFSGAANAFPDGIHFLNAALGIRDKTPPSSTVTIPGYTTTNSGGAIELTITSGATPEATTYSIPPSTFTVNPEVIVVPPIVKATVCPQPTGLTRDPSVKWTGNYGCPNGQICTPEKPEGCNVWPGPPRADFKCNENDCIPIPLSKPETRSDGGFHPAWGFFHIDPRRFGQGYEVFQYDHTSGGQLGALNLLGTRQSVPGACMSICQSAYQLAAGFEDGTVDPDVLCNEDRSRFIGNLRQCTGCLGRTTNATRETMKDALGPGLEKMLGYCEAVDPFPSDFPDPQEPGTGSTTTTAQDTPAPPSTPVIPPSNPITTADLTTTTTTETSSLPPTTPPPTTTSPPTTSSPEPPTTESTSSVESTIAPDSSSTGPDESTPSEATSSSGTLPDSSSSSAESPSSGSPGAPSAGSPEPSSTDSPESPPTGSADVPSASAAETPGSPESQATDSPSASDPDAPAPGTSFEPEEPENTPAPSAPIVTTDETGTRTTLGVVPDPVPTTQDTVVVPTETPGGTPAPAPPPPPSSAAFRMTVGATILATLLTVLAALA